MSKANGWQPYTKWRFSLHDLKLYCECGNVLLLYLGKTTQYPKCTGCGREYRVEMRVQVKRREEAANGA